MTTETTLHPLPRSRAVLGEQFRVVGLALRREWLLVFLGLGFLTLTLVLNSVRAPAHSPRPRYDMDGELFGVLAILGFFAPMSVWKHEGPSRRGFHWAMPLGRARHTLLKCLAGWGWTMLLVAVFLLWSALAAWATGGHVWMLGFSVYVPGSGMLARDFRALPGWFWIVPFAGMTLAYLIGSVVTLLADRPWAWAAGIVVGFLVVSSTLSSAGLEEPVRALDAMLRGEYGLRTALSGMTRAQETVAVRGRAVALSMDLPNLQAWLVAMLLWAVPAGGLALWAANRHPED